MTSTERRPPSSAALRWVAVTVFALASAVNFLDRLTLSAFAPRIIAEFHLTYTQYGFLSGSAFGLPYALFGPFAGWLLDRIGLETGIICAVALWSLSAAICGLTRTYNQLVGARALLGMWESVGIPAAGKLNSIYLEPKDRAIGAAMTQIGIGIASVVAPLLVGEFAGWRSPFFLCAALGLGWIPLWLVVRRSIQPWSEVAPQTRGGGWKILRDRRLAYLAAANIVWMIGYTFWQNWITLYLSRVYHLTNAQAASYAWVPPLASVLGGFAGGWMSRRAINRGADPVSARVSVLFFGAVGCLTTLLAPFCPTPLTVLAPICISYFALLAGSVNIYTIPLDIWGGERAGTALSVLGFAYGLMQVVVSLLIGELVDHFGFTPVCWLVALPPFAGWLLLRRLRETDW